MGLTLCSRYLEFSQFAHLACHLTPARAELGRQVNPPRSPCTYIGVFYASSFDVVITICVSKKHFSILNLNRKVLRWRSLLSSVSQMSNVVYIYMQAPREASCEKCTRAKNVNREKVGKAKLLAWVSVMRL